MKIWIVDCGHDYEGGIVAGIFANPDSAQKMKEAIDIDIKKYIRIQETDDLLAKRWRTVYEPKIRQKKKNSTKKNSTWYHPFTYEITDRLPQPKYKCEWARIKEYEVDTEFKDKVRTAIHVEEQNA